MAKMLGEGEALLDDIALMNLNPEDGRVYVVDLAHEASTTAFTPFGVDSLKELLADLKPNQTPE